MSQDKHNRSNMRYDVPLKGLFELQKPTILAAGVHILCSDKKIREVKMPPKLADKILGLIKHVHGGVINLSPHTLEIYFVPPPVSKGEGDYEIYIPLAYQLMRRNPIHPEHSGLSFVR